MSLRPPSCCFIGLINYHFDGTMHIHYTPSNQANCSSAFVFRDTCVISDMCECRWEIWMQWGITQCLCCWIGNENKGCVQVSKIQRAFCRIVCVKKSKSSWTCPYCNRYPAASWHKTALSYSRFSTLSKQNLFYSPEKDMRVKKKIPSSKDPFLT